MATIEADDKPTVIGSGWFCGCRITGKDADHRIYLGDYYGRGCVSIKSTTARGRQCEGHGLVTFRKCVVVDINEERLVIGAS
ncbi:MAG TPA: hypothetical protein DCR55_02615 [Lentisphaeria bacterium]|nr:hypothetical protein [Lentisphaeria bacterium]